jgi:hypothetical protein
MTKRTQFLEVWAWKDRDLRYWNEANSDWVGGRHRRGEDSTVVEACCHAGLEVVGSEGEKFSLRVSPGERGGRPQWGRYCGWTPHMATIQIIVDEPLLKAPDREAKRQKMNRSALIRDALREHLKRLRQRDFEERDRRGYEAQPQRTEEYSPWEEIAAWPDE